MGWRRRWSEVEAVTSGGDERGHLGQSPPSRRTERTRDTCHSRVMADTALLPVDMSKQEKSPPPLTKLVHRKPSSPREFFEKLYGPDPTREEEKSSSPSTETAVSTNINNNLHGSFPGCDSANQPLLSSSYLPAFPLPPHEVGLINCSLDNVPFPGGLAAFCK